MIILHGPIEAAWTGVSVSAQPILPGLKTPCPPEVGPRGHRLHTSDVTALIPSPPYNFYFFPRIKLLIDCFFPRVFFFLVKMTRFKNKTAKILKKNCSPQLRFVKPEAEGEKASKRLRKEGGGGEATEEPGPIHQSPIPTPQSAPRIRAYRNRIDQVRPPAPFPSFFPVRIPPDQYRFLLAVRLAD